MFPIKLENKIHGPFEAIGLIIGLIVGLCIGWVVGYEAVEYVNKLEGNFNVIDITVKNYPIITRLVALSFCAGIVSKWSRLATSLIDKIFRTYEE